MNFQEILNKTIEMLRNNKKLSYRAIKRQFDIDDAYLEDLKFEIIEVQKLAEDQDNKFLILIDTLAEGTSEKTDKIITPQPEVEVAPERRHLTIMFCDLAGSTALSGKLDPEDLRETTIAYQKACVNAVENYSGYVAKYLGDGMLIYFGYPHAHEDDPQRAISAALAMINAMKDLNQQRQLPGQDYDLDIRVGIHTGLVVAGKVGAGETREEFAIVGEAPNIAARLQGVAELNAVVISEDTKALTKAYFEFKDLGEHELKGVDKPMHVYQVEKQVEYETRFAARYKAVRHTAAFFGREEELDQLSQCWQQTKKKHGQVALIFGEAGIGKSRLVEASKGFFGSDNPMILNYQSSSLQKMSAFFPFIQHLMNKAQIHEEDLSEQRFQKLEALLSKTSSKLKEDVPLFASLLGIPPNDRYQPLELDPLETKTRVANALIDQLITLSKIQPVFMFFEDTHWSDPSSIELLAEIINRIPDERIMLIITYRNEFESPWPDQPYITELPLKPLSTIESGEIVKNLIGNKKLPEDVFKQIVEKTDGVPLFVEELTKSILESGLLHETPEGYESDPNIPFEIPFSLQDALAARLDRLSSSEKKILQVGATLGQNFSRKMLEAIAELHDPDLKYVLDQLTEVYRLFILLEKAPRELYMFEHALVQDLAYETMLKSRRRVLHKKIVDLLEAEYPNIVETRPEVLAYHYMKGDIPLTAAEYFTKAGMRSKAMFDNKEAVLSLSKALELLMVVRDIDKEHAPELKEKIVQLMMTLGGLESLNGELEKANQYYKSAMDLTPDEKTKKLYKNMIHTPDFVIRDKGRIVFYKHGSGEQTLLFINPILYGLSVFQPILERLCQNYTIITIDCRGAGRSDPFNLPYGMDQHVEDAAAVLEKLGAKNVTGVGISYGGILLFKLAHKYPRLLQKIVTIGSPVANLFLENPTPSAKNISRSEPEYIKQAQTAIQKKHLMEAVEIHGRQIFSEPEALGLIGVFCQICSKLPANTILSFFDTKPILDVTPFLHTIKQPILATHGAADRLIPLTASEYIVEHAPNAKLCTFEGKGHLPIFTATDEFIDALKQFLETSYAKA